MNPETNLIEYLFSANLTLVALLVVIIVFLITQYLEERFSDIGETYRSFLILMGFVLILSGVNSFLSLIYLLNFPSLASIYEYLLYVIIFLSMLIVISIIAVTMRIIICEVS